MEAWKDVARRWGPWGVRGETGGGGLVGRGSWGGGPEGETARCPEGGKLDAAVTAVKSETESQRRSSNASSAATGGRSGGREVKARR